MRMCKYRNFVLCFLMVFVCFSVLAQEQVDEEVISEETGEEVVEQKHYPSGELEAEWTEIDGKRNGIYKSFYESGEMKDEFQYVDHALDGEQKQYYEDGTLKKEWTSVKGKRQGPGKVYYPNGRLKKSLAYKNNKLDGRQDIYRESGVLHRIKTYKGGKLHGVQKGYWLNGNVSAVYFYQDDQLHGEYNTYSPTGQVIQTSTYKNGELVSSTVDKSKARLTEDEEEYKIKAQDLDEEFYDTKKLRSLATYETGVLDGLIKRYFENGGIKSITHYIEGLRDGLQILYYETGEVQSRLNFVGGDLNGIQEVFYKNGVLKSRENYKNGALDGPQEYYYENGVLLARKLYQQGTMIRYQRYVYENGVLKTVEEFIDGVVSQKQAGDETDTETFLDVEEAKDIFVPTSKKEFYEDGTTLKMEFVVSEDQQVSQRLYHPNGELKLDLQWDGSNFFSFSEYDEEGELIEDDLSSIFKNADLIQNVQLCQMLKGRYENEECFLPTEDANKECIDKIQCQGLCLAFEATAGSNVQGGCSDWTGGIEGCYSLVEGGRASQPQGDCL